MPPSLMSYLEFARAVTRAAGDLTLEYFRSGVAVDHKPDHSPVTMADREAEALIRREITARHPDHAVLGEEQGASGPARASHRWIIDPIDGTRAFVRGVPLYGVLVGLEIEGRCVVGVADFPALGETIAAARGEGCDWSGGTAGVSEVGRLADGIVAHANAASFERAGKGQAWLRLQGAAGFCAGWADAYAYLLVATGRAEVAIDPVMREWDCAPFLPILEEAGGYFGDWRGNATIYGGEALATTTGLLPEVLRVLGGG
ncbi:MAG TPA: inositol monophosphatase family protein [Gemmatimonadales bacterium]|nr:inositol monophosphatase family protein [Gemmatimonadales bacterium]